MFLVNLALIETRYHAEFARYRLCSELTVVLFENTQIVIFAKVYEEEQGHSGKGISGIC